MFNTLPLFWFVLEVIAISVSSAILIGVAVGWLLKKKFIEEQHPQLIS